MLGMRRSMSVRGGSQPLLLSNRRPQAQVQLGDTGELEVAGRRPPHPWKGLWAPPRPGK